MAAAAVSVLKKRSLISEPINIVTGSLGSAKTLWAIEQADLLRESGDADQVYQIGINEPDTRFLPHLPFPLDEWYLRADAGELKNAVIIIDEFHKVMPQRAQNSRPPKWIEEMAEARKRGVRFLLITQSGEFDHFLKGTRLNRHFYLSRKAGMKRSNILEWQSRFVSNPEENKDARASAIKHLNWKHPIKKYGSWYVSAASHHFRLRLPLRFLIVPPFVAALVYFGYQAYASVGGMISGDIVPAASATASDVSGSSARTRNEVITKPDDYMRQFVPVIATMPFSAPAYQGRDVVAKPDLICSSAGSGVDGNGDYVEASCSCFTEQMTPYDIDPVFCEKIAHEGYYNPYRQPIDSEGGESDGKGDPRPRPTAPAATGVLSSTDQVSSYGDFRVGAAGSANPPPVGFD